ncbi:helix-turn-helix domain-containing protein [Anaeromicropila herbilytica]|uniref:HTH cro/C1-type domain-containing protein n=1 Tax=Anaeromicropila herbilytica TaxID=2785025 RepID=A0A7R7IBZ4_9FIRM|nr:helix-turn-helix transcriptional regulator [Anaeromicropila herbilytica]BCN30168.1 hypothetical protein bsdtb5_14630 [Anaeromicropila herbilytica]
MNNRVKEIRESLKMSQEEFGQIIGLTKSSISNIENRTRNVTEKHIKLICNEFHINEKWLRFGSGDMYDSKSKDDFQKIADYYKLDELDIQILKEYSKLDSDKRSVIKDFIKQVAISSVSHTMFEPDQLVSEKTRYGEKDR